MRSRYHPPRRLLLACGLALVSVAFVSGCGSGSASGTHAPQAVSPAAYYNSTAGASPGNSPRRGGVLTIAWSFTAGGLDPSILPDQGSYLVTEMMFGHLLKWLPGRTTPAPDLATGWTESADGLTYRFPLRQDARFSDGAPITPADVLFSIQRVTTPTNPAYSELCCSQVRSVSLSGPRTLQITLRRPYRDFVDYMPDFTEIIPKAYFQRVGERQFALHPVSSGPFAVKRFTPDGVIELVRNPYYWQKGVPYLNGVTFVPTPDSNLRTLTVTTGQADVADGIPYATIASLTGAAGTRLLTQPLADVSLIQLNQSSGPLRDSKVRLALSYATPRAAILSDVFHGYARLANADFPPGTDWSSSIKQVPYDLPEAKRLLATSSAPHGFPLQILVTSGDPSADLIASIVRSSWSQLGLSVTIRQVDSGTFAAATLSPSAKYQAAVVPAIFWTSNIPAPDEMAQFFINPDFAPDSFYTFFDDPSVTALAQQELTTVSEAQHRALLQRLQSLSITDPSVIALAYPDAVVLVRSDVCDFTTLFNGVYALQTTYLASRCS